MLCNTTPTLRDWGELNNSLRIKAAKPAPPTTAKWVLPPTPAHHQARELHPLNRTAWIAHLVTAAQQSKCCFSGMFISFHSHLLYAFLGWALLRPSETRVPFSLRGDVSAATKGSRDGRGESMHHSRRGWDTLASCVFCPHNSVVDPSIY